MRHLSSSVRNLSFTIPFITHSKTMTTNASSRSSSSTSVSPPNLSFRVTPLPQRHTQWPYTSSDFDRMDPSSDTTFYSSPRFVTHIDDTAISALGKYYDESLPRTGKILDLCSSWVSHFPPDLADRATKTARARARSPNPDSQSADETLEVVGVGVNEAELSANPILSSYHLIDLNTSPSLNSPSSLGDAPGTFDAATCVVSIDYLTQPVQVLSSLRDLLVKGGTVHVALSNRCFPTKVIRRWLSISEDERVRMVGDYLHFAGYGEVEVVEVVKAGEGGFKGATDPLWVVRGRKME